MAKDFVKLRKLPGQNQELGQLQSNIDDAFTSIQDSPPLRGVLIKGVTLVTGTNNAVDHGMGRAYQGFIISGINANANVWEGGTNPQPTTQIVLQSSANCVVNLWVY